MTEALGKPGQDARGATGSRFLVYEGSDRSVVIVIEGDRVVSYRQTDRVELRPQAP